MSDFTESSTKFKLLREQAEHLLHHQTEAALPPPGDMLELIHELQIHQVELSIQNEELKRAQQELTDLHHEYENLYEFAPCGYVTLNSKGIINKINLTGVSLLGKVRTFILHCGFSEFIAPGWENTYLKARQKAAETGEKQSVELPLEVKDDHPLWVQAEIDAVRDKTGAVMQWRMVLVDITQKKMVEADNKKLEDQLRQSQKMETIGTLADRK